MSSPFSVDLTLSAPPEEGEPAESYGYTSSGVFTTQVAYDLNFTGSGTKSLDLGSIGNAGAKLLMVKVAVSSEAAIVVKLNGENTGHEVSPNGFLLLVSPDPSSGITAVSLTYSDTSRVWVRLLG